MESVSASKAISSWVADEVTSSFFLSADSAIPIGSTPAETVRSSRPASGSTTETVRLPRLVT